MDGEERIRRRRGITPELQQAAWQLRGRMTPAEQALWEALRDRRLGGMRFRRQHPVGQFVLDFYCSREKLVIELDGGVHDARVEQNAARTVYLSTYAYRVVRFRNEDVLSDLPAVLEQIADFAHSGSPIIEGFIGVGLEGIQLYTNHKEKPFNAEGTGR